MGFRVEWCNERFRYVGICSLWPLYKYYAESAEEAMVGIIALIEGLDEDHEVTAVDDSLEVSMADTKPNVVEITNVCWPPQPVSPGIGQALTKALRKCPSSPRKC